MTPEEVLERLRPWREKHRRPAWKPVVEPGDGPATASKFGGAAWLRAGEEWPACPHCEDPLAHFLSLDLASAPEGSPARQEGLLQLFYCTNDEAECDIQNDGSLPFSDVAVVRIVHPAREPGRDVAEPDDLESRPSRIVGWTALEDLPHPSEHELRGVEYAYDFPDGTVTIACADPELALRDLPLGQGVEWAETIAQAAEGDKLGGWPYWVQNADYPSCPRCDARMERVLFQLESEEHIPYMFGDSGCGHVTQCPRHPDVVAFAWACC